MGQNNQGFKDYQQYIASPTSLIKNKQNKFQMNHPDHIKKKFKDTKFGHFLWKVGDFGKNTVEGVGKEIGTILHTTEDAVGNVSKGIGGIGQGIGDGMKILSNPYIIFGICGVIVLYKVL